LTKLELHAVGQIPLLLAHKVMDFLILQVIWLLALIIDALTPEKQVEGSFVNEAYILLD